LKKSATLTKINGLALYNNEDKPIRLKVIIWLH